MMKTHHACCLLSDDDSCCLCFYRRPSFASDFFWNAPTSFWTGDAHFLYNGKNSQRYTAQDITLIQLSKVTLTRYTTATISIKFLTTPPSGTVYHFVKLKTTNSKARIKCTTPARYNTSTHRIIFIQSMKRNQSHRWPLQLENSTPTLFLSFLLSSITAAIASLDIGIVTYLYNAPANTNWRHVYNTTLACLVRPGHPGCL